MNKNLEEKTSAPTSTVLVGVLTNLVSMMNWLHL